MTLMGVGMKSIFLDRIDGQKELYFFAIERTNYIKNGVSTKKISWHKTG